MCERRMLEVAFVIRPMMELCANQAVMNTDPKLAERFSLEEHASNVELIAMLEKHGTDESEEAIRKAAEVEGMGRQLREFGYDDVAKAFPPFGMTARKRFELADMNQYYETFYSVASDFTHMNGRAIHRYLDGDLSDERVTSG